MTLTRHLFNARYIAWRKPRFILRTARFYLSRNSATPPLRYVDFAITNACNLACHHCFQTALQDPSRPTLHPTDVARIADQAIRLGAIHLSLQGGEPTIHPRLREFIAALQPSRVLVSITTNGTCITPDLARNLRAWGVDQLNVSLDSFDRTEHDRFRGQPGAWLRTMDGIRTARRAGLRIQINTTVTHQNLHSWGFNAILDWAYHERFMVNLVFAASVGRLAADSQASLTPADIAHLDQIIHSKFWVRHDRHAITLDGPCPAIVSAIYVSSSGDLLPCPFIHHPIANLLTTPLAQARQKYLNHPQEFRCHAAENPQAYIQAIKNHPG